MPQSHKDILDERRRLSAGDLDVYPTPQCPLPMNFDQLYNESLALLEGKGIQKDEQQSFEINRKAAVEGHADATLAMGWFYLNGVGVARSISDAITWTKANKTDSRNGSYGICHAIGASRSPLPNPKHSVDS